MSSSKHEKSFVDFDKPYEQNVIGLKGILYFGIGLFLLIVITFGLMALFLNELEKDAEQSKKSDNPMAMSDKERLPPEPRVQGAPGFGVDGPNGRVNMELKAPQSEWWELEKQYKDLWKNGMKDPKTGAISAMPIDQAKALLLTQNPKAKSGPEAEKLLNDSKLRFSDASSGRVATDRRR
jgi:hypothetical protein